MGGLRKFSNAAAKGTFGQSMLVVVVEDGVESLEPSFAGFRASVFLYTDPHRN